jgi:hypothetical protein
VAPQAADVDNTAMHLMVVRSHAVPRGVVVMVYRIVAAFGSLVQSVVAVVGVFHTTAGVGSKSGLYFGEKNQARVPNSLVSLQSHFAMVKAPWCLVTLVGLMAEDGCTDVLDGVLVHSHHLYRKSEAVIHNHTTARLCSEKSRVVLGHPPGSPWVADAEPKCSRCSCEREVGVECRLRPPLLVALHSLCAHVMCTNHRDCGYPSWYGTLGTDRGAQSARCYGCSDSSAVARPGMKDPGRNPLDSSPVAEMRVCPHIPKLRCKDPAAQVLTRSFDEWVRLEQSARAAGRPVGGESARERI